MTIAHFAPSDRPRSTRTVPNTDVTDTTRERPHAHTTHTDTSDQWYDRQSMCTALVDMRAWGLAQPVRAKVPFACALSHALRATPDGSWGAAWVARALLASQGRRPPRHRRPLQHRTPHTTPPPQPASALVHRGVSHAMTMVTCAARLPILTRVCTHPLLSTQAARVVDPGNARADGQLHCSEGTLNRTAGAVAEE